MSYENKEAAHGMSMSLLDENLDKEQKSDLVQRICETLHD